tara:strand:+ start:192 stop:1199 length:1008 start_codon:yes stop_codon:yes gene_type:complete
MYKRKHYEVSHHNQLDDNSYFQRYQIIEKIKENYLNLKAKRQRVNINSTNSKYKGSGSFSDVYKIKCDNCDYAFKLTFNEGVKNIGAINEAIILNKLSKAKSPYILNLINFGYSSILNSYILQSEYMTFNLYTLSKSYDLNDKFRNYIYKCTSMGLKHLHFNKVIHCDIKPGNILISSDFKKVKICDFNISVYNKKDTKTHSTNKITVNYRPPELFLGYNEFNEKIDIWSLGVIIYELENKDEFYISEEDDININLSCIQNLVGRIELFDNLEYYDLISDDLKDFLINSRVDFPLINMLDSNEYFEIIKNCLKYNISERSSASQIVDSLNGIIKV